MRLFVAEKPSLARAIADALPAPQRRSRTHIECGAHDVVAWCAGHILQPAPPEAYGEGYKTWRLDALPIAPTDWKLRVSTPELYGAITRLLESATRVVHAGDPDREGQLLVDEVLAHAGYRGPVDRLLIRDLSSEAVHKALGALEPNEKYRPLSDSALARQRADWLYGMNMTRLYTLLGRAAGYQGVLSVGRVQTPLLGLIVSRDRAIAEFPDRAVLRRRGGNSGRRREEVPGVLGAAAGGKPRRRRAACRPRGRCRHVCAYPRASGARRLMHPRQEDPGAASALFARGPPNGRRQTPFDERQGRTRRVSKPLRDAPARHVPALGLQLPPRGSPRASRRGALGDRKARAIAPPCDCQGRPQACLKKAWNDKKVTAHHAIIPTPRAGAASMNEAERAIYALVASRYVAQFYGAHEFLQTRLELEIAGERFVATGRQTLSAGWTALSADLETSPQPSDAKGEADADRAHSAPLPRLSPGDRVTVTAASVLDKETCPPKPFTDGSLIATMCSHRQVRHRSRRQKDPDRRRRHWDACHTRRHP